MYTSKLELENKIKQSQNKIINVILRKEKHIRRKTNKNNQKYLYDKNQEYDYLLSSIDGHNLDQIQREIILSEEDSTLVVAGAGSGKTLTILGKILYLVQTGVNPKDILCLSFTNAACNNLKQKLLRNGIKMDIYTFHKLGIKILKEHGTPVNIVRENILSKIIRNILKQNKILDVLPNYDFKDFGEGNFENFHHLLALETKEFDDLNMLFFTFINLFKGNNFEISQFETFQKEACQIKDKFTRKRHQILLSLAQKIYEEYTYYLHKNKLIDFHDMINKAIDIIKEYGMHNYKYIIVDEYQDTSLVKCEFLKTIKEKCGAKMMAVGDDFQSIYRFTGSNLNVFLDFKKYFPYTKIFKLEKTYRNSKELLNIMGKFILKNKRQIPKTLISDKHNQNPIYIYYYNQNVKEVLDLVLQKVGNDTLILGRNNKDINHLKIDKGTKMTVHKSKGLEADNVILVNLTDDINGFPNKIITDDFLKYVINTKESYPYEEERRLFYVALTRTRNNNYLLVNKNKPSIFVQELIRDNKNIKIMNDNLCPKCGSILIKKSGKYGFFYGCSNFPKCHYTKNYH